MQAVHVALAERSYTIHSHASFPEGVGQLARQVAPRAASAFVAADANTHPHAETIAASLREANFRVTFARVPAGEGAKSLTELAKLYDALAAIPADRNTLVVAVGGGVVGDLVGFAAATFNRGLPLFMVPTTLLAMVDSSVGGKVAVNHATGKNLIGAFHQPAAVWIDIAMLQTLPTREYLSGLAEVVKYGVALDAEFFARLEQLAGALVARDPEPIAEVVAKSCAIKAGVVAADEREETGLRAVLNYGHTFAHAFEAVGGYGTLLHGEAVSIGMVCAAKLAERLGRIPVELVARQDTLLAKLGLPTRAIPADVEELIASMRRDKKSIDGALRFVLPSRLGHAEIVADVPESLVAEVLAAC